MSDHFGLTFFLDFIYLDYKSFQSGVDIANVDQGMAFL